MIILYDKQEQVFTSLGLGVLKDAISCTVVEELNGAFELEMEYPITGQHFNDITLKRIILAKPNIYDNAQPFRIYNITKPINGVVTISAEHISYDMSGYMVKAFDSQNLQGVLNFLMDQDYIVPQNNSLFEFFADAAMIEKGSTITMKTKLPYSMRALLAGSDGSIVGIYGGEYKFDRYVAHLLSRRGADRGVSIRYGKNMTDFEQQTSSEKMYTGVFPFFSASYTETKTTSGLRFWYVYVVNNTTPFTVGWLSLKEDITALYDPLIEEYPVQIKTAGTYLNKVVVYRKSTETEVYIKDGSVAFGSDWFDGISHEPGDTNMQKNLYLVKTEGDYLNKVYIWNGFSYVEYSKKGFFYILDIIPEKTLLNSIPDATPETVEKEEYVDLTSTQDSYIRTEGTPLTANWLSSKVDGVALIPNENNIYLVKTEGEYFDKKYVWKTTFYEEFSGSAIIYIDETAVPQRLLTLDLSSMFSEKPTVGLLKLKAQEYIANNNLGQIVESTTVSFIKLADSPEYERYAELERVELGDTVRIFHEYLGIETTLHVVETEFDAITEKYNEITLGSRAESLSGTAITKNDSVSSLSNDSRFVDATTVNRLIVQTITAEYIQATKAHLSEALIDDLSVAKIVCPGIIEASQLYIDELVAKLITAENAEIKNVLKAGTVEIAGTIHAIKGDIGGVIIEDGSLYALDPENPQEVAFKLTKDGKLIASNAYVKGDINADTLRVGEDGIKILDAEIKYLVGEQTLLRQDVIFVQGTNQITHSYGANQTVIDHYIQSRVEGIPSNVWQQEPILIPFSGRKIANAMLSELTFLNGAGLSSLPSPYTGNVPGSHVFASIMDFILHPVVSGDETKYGIITGYKWEFLGTNLKDSQNLQLYPNRISKTVGDGGNVVADANNVCVPCYNLLNMFQDPPVNPSTICLRIHEEYVAVHYWHLVEVTTEVGGFIPRIWNFNHIEYSFVRRLVLLADTYYINEQYGVTGLFCPLSVGPVVPGSVIEYKSSAEELPTLGIHANMFPSQNEMFDLGSSTKKWDTLFVRQIEGLEQILGETISEAEIKDPLSTVARLISGQRFSQAFSWYKEKTHVSVTTPPENENYMTWLEIIEEE